MNISLSIESSYLWSGISTSPSERRLRATPLSGCDHNINVCVLSPRLLKFSPTAPATTRTTKLGLPAGKRKSIVKLLTSIRAHSRSLNHVLLITIQSRTQPSLSRDTLRAGGEHLHDWPFRTRSCAMEFSLALEYDLIMAEGAKFVAVELAHLPYFSIRSNPPPPFPRISP